jgi:hypothetical protein
LTLYSHTSFLFAASHKYYQVYYSTISPLGLPLKLHLENYSATLTAMQPSETDLLEKLDRYQSAKKRKARKSAALALIILTFLAATVWSGYSWIQHRQLTARVPANIREEAGFPIYMPSENKIRPEPKTFDYSNGVILFTAVAGNTRFTISEQQKPAEFDLSKFSTAQGLSNAKEVTLKSGQALIGTVHGLSIGIIDTGKTIITITCPDSNADMESVLKSFEKI